MYTYGSPGEYTTLTTDYMPVDEGYYGEKNGSSKLILVLILVALGGAAYFLFGTEAGASLVGGSQQQTTDGNAFSSSYSTREEAVSRLEAVVGKTAGTKYSNYYIYNGSLAGYAYKWFTWRNKKYDDEASTVKLVRTFTSSCSKNELQPGDLLVDAARSFSVIFTGWANSDKSKYNLIYFSPGSEKVVKESFNYPYPKDAQGNYYRNVVPRCLKSSFFKKASTPSNPSGPTGGGSNPPPTPSSKANGPCALSDTACWNKEIAKENWGTETLGTVKHWKLNEFTGKSSKAISDDANKRTTLQFAYELEAVWFYWNRNDGYTWPDNWGSYNNGSSGINITSYDPVNKRITVRPSGGRYSYFAFMLIQYWRGAKVLSNEYGVQLTLNEGFQPPVVNIPARNDSTPSGSIGSSSTNFTCGINHYGCWKKAASTIDWNNTNSSLTKSFDLYEFTNKGLSHSAVKKDLELQAKVIRFVSQLQKAKDIVTNVTGTGVNILKCDFTASVPYVRSAATAYYPAGVIYGELCRRHLPQTVITNWDDPTVYLPDLAPEFGFRGYTTNFSAAKGLDPLVEWPGLTNPMPSSGAVFTCPFGDDYHNDSSRTHAGLDISDGVNGLNTDIVAAAAGIVRQVGWSGYGKSVVLEHEVNGHKITTLYAHMYSINSKIKKGGSVSAGQKLGKMGGSGNGEKLEAFGAHLHFEFCFGAGTSAYSSTNRDVFVSGDNCMNPLDFIRMKQYVVG